MRKRALQRRGRGAPSERLIMKYAPPPRTTPLVEMACRRSGGLGIIRGAEGHRDGERGERDDQVRDCQHHQRHRQPHLADDVAHTQEKDDAEDGEDARHLYQRRRRPAGAAGALRRAAQKRRRTWTALRQCERLGARLRAQVPWRTLPRGAEGERGRRHIHAVPERDVWAPQRRVAGRRVHGSGLLTDSRSESSVSSACDGLPPPPPAYTSCASSGLPFPPACEAGGEEGRWERVALAGMRRTGVSWWDGAAMEGLRWGAGGRIAAWQRGDRGLLARRRAAAGLGPKLALSVRRMPSWDRSIADRGG